MLNYYLLIKNRMQRNKEKFKFANKMIKKANILAQTKAFVQVFEDF